MTIRGNQVEFLQPLDKSPNECIRFLGQSKTYIFLDQGAGNGLINNEGDIVGRKQTVELPHLCGRGQIAIDFLGDQARNDQRQIWADCTE